MNTFIHPARNEWRGLLARPAFDHDRLFDSVRKILLDVKRNGDAAARKYTSQFDKTDIDQFEVSPGEIDKAAEAVPHLLQQAITTAAKNIERFHASQLTDTAVVEIMPGIKCWRKSVPVEKVGLYIPGGTAPLFSTVLMLGIPARLAGCKEIILCTPPSYHEDGTGRSQIHPAILFAARHVGITRIFKVGGVQAVAAMAYGTGSIPAVYKIFGPGNQYVNCAKQLIQLDGISIDMPAGPSEVCVFADEAADPSFVAADLLSQAEHGTDSQVLLVASSLDFVNKTLSEIDKQMKLLPRRDVVEKVLSNSNAIVMTDPHEAIELVNEYAPEHLIIACRNAAGIAAQVVNAGSVFLGNYSPESAGDYASGTNHVLPTNGFAKSYAGVSIDSFVKKITYQEITKEGLENIGPTVEIMANAENLAAHANAVTIRLKQ